MDCLQENQTGCKVGGGNLRPPRTYSIDQFCEAFNVSHAGFYNMLKRGEIRAVKINGRLKIPFDEGERLLKIEL